MKKIINDKKENINDYDKKYFLLNPECYFVKGAKRGAIYNLYTSKLLSLNPKLNKVLKKCEDGNSLFNIPEFNEEKENVMESLFELEKMDIGRFYESFYVIEKLNSRKYYDLLNMYFFKRNLKVLFLEITSNCNLNCSFCFKNTYKIYRTCGCKRGVKLLNKNNIPLDLRDWRLILDDVKKLRCNNIIFIGGEPLLERETLLSLIKYSRSIGIKNITVFTNGVLIENNLINLFEKNDIELIIQIFSNEKEIGDRITRTENYTNKLLENLHKLNESKIKYSFYYTSIKEYENDEKKSIKYFWKFKPSKIFIVELFTKLNKEKLEFNFKSNNNDLFTCTLNHIKYDKFFRNYYGNSCWNEKLAISENGDILPCHLAKNIVIGNIKEKSIREIFRDGDMLKYWKMSKDYSDVCKYCEFRYFCPMCIPFEKSLNYYNNSKEKNNYCNYNPFLGKWEKGL